MNVLRYLNCDGENILISYFPKEVKSWRSPKTKKLYTIGGGQEGRINHNGGVIDYASISFLIKSIREDMTWESYYDKNQNMLETPIKTKLKDLSDSHLKNCLRINKRSSFISKIFEEELNFRKENKIVV